jgi:hypothetical protein
MTNILPYDLVLFRGKDLISKVITEVQDVSTNHDEFSHIGIIVTHDILPQVPNLFPDKLYVMESTSNLSKLDGPKTVDNKRDFGVQIRDYNQLLQEYNGEIYIGKLINNPYPAYKFLNEMQTVYDKYIDASYNANCVDLCAAAFRCFRKARNKIDEKYKNNNVYCSEFVAIILKTINILPAWIDTRNYLPVDVLGIRDDYPKIIEEKIKVKNN